VSNILLRFRNRHFFAVDFLVLLVTPALALSLRVSDAAVFRALIPSLALVTILFLAVRLALFYTLDLYRRYWIYASVDELARIALAVGTTLLINYGLFFVLRSLGAVSSEFPASVLLTETLFVFLAVGGSRFSVRLARHLRDRALPIGDRTPTLIVGAGEAGAMIASEMMSNATLGFWPVAFVDDARKKHGLQIRGVTVEGASGDIEDIARMYGVTHVVIALPSASGQAIRRIHDRCIEAGLETKTIPGLSELLDGSVQVSQIRPVRIEDLLRRDPVRVEESAIASMIRGSRILVTGGGGSIGSELCRQILKYHPASLIVLDHSEDAVFSMMKELAELKERLGVSCDIRGRIGDIRSRNRVEEVFDVCLPQIVFHAAAHKHVPLLEDNICEAVTNNVQGTLNVLDACVAFDVDRFVMLSSDKAVNPTSVMGATKRIAEMLVKEAAREHSVPFVSVRFGNVLGSRGSVVPRFQHQIRSGGPVTVTHTDMERYFMSIPEAVQLVLQAGALAHGGEIYVLDMGEPIRIVDLANDLIRLSGFLPGKDIEIVFSGLRKGEKLKEELFFADETVRRTRHDKVLVAAAAVQAETADGPRRKKNVRETVDALVSVAERQDPELTLALIGEMLPTYARLARPENAPDPRTGRRPSNEPQPAESPTSR
jgi:FlaA1/EpsC-like NDP-sugar epimerase